MRRQKEKKCRQENEKVNSNTGQGRVSQRGNRETQVEEIASNILSEICPGMEDMTEPTDYPAQHVKIDA